MSKTHPRRTSFRHISSGSHQKLAVVESPVRKIVARVSDVDLPLSIACRLDEQGNHGTAGRVVLVRLTAQLKIGSEVAPHCAVLVKLKRAALKASKDASRCTRHHEESQPEGEGQNALQPSEDRSADAAAMPRSSQTGSCAPVSKDLPADEARAKDEQQCDWPHRAGQEPRL
eukprot:2575741-Prymnesium_polylepis.1